MNERSSRMVAVRKYRQEKVVVSLDIHEQNTFVYAVDMGNGEVLTDRNISGPPRRAVEHMALLQLPRERTEVVFEAGNLGYYPYRELYDAGYTALMIAPTSIPRRGNKQKTDRDDAHDNLDYHVAGLLHYVTIPAMEDEHVRELLRYRKRASDEVIKQKQQIRSYCTRQGLFFTGTKTAWTRAHRAWLKIVQAAPAVRLYLDIRMDDLAHLEQRQKRINTELDRLFEQNSRYTHLLNSYLLLPGVGRVTAMTLVLEGGALERFSHPGALMNYTGLVPRKHASGSSDPSLHITKAGNFYLRLMMVGAAKVYGSERAMRVAVKRIGEMPDGSTKTFVNKLVTRLSTRTRYLRAKKKHVNKVRCAIARELCGFIWEYYMTIIMPMMEVRSAA